MEGRSKERARVVETDRARNELKSVIIEGFLRLGTEAVVLMI